MTARNATATPVLSATAPEPGQLVEVRRRQWIVSDVNASAVTTERIDALRSIQREMDLAAMRAFDWNDIELDHDFCAISYLPENDRVRLSVSERTRTELLRRLCDLNHQRQEQAAGAKKVTTGSTKREVSSAQLGLATLPTATRRRPSPLRRGRPHGGPDETQQRHREGGADQAVLRVDAHARH